MSNNITNMNNEINDDSLVDVIFDSTSEMLVFVDKDGCIKKLSKAYAEFLGIDRDESVGKPVNQVIENTRMHLVLESGKDDTESMQKLKGKNMIASRWIVHKDGEVVGALGRVLFRDIAELQTLFEKMKKMESELDIYKKQFGKIHTSKYNLDQIIGTGTLMSTLKDTVKKVARTNSNILILGESGTGKELFAHAIHGESKRRDKPFICINCGTIPTELLESELFGYEEGAFTGAKKGGKTGMFQAANKGTVFLDEIGDLPMNMQVKLLRFLQEREIQKIGAFAGEQVDVRIVAATNKNLYDMVEKGEFRSDLYYRLNVVSLNIPALRSRKEDIPLLTQALLKKIGLRENLSLKPIPNSVMEYLKRYDWPGNVRELENTLERAINFLEEDQTIKITHLPSRVTGLKSHGELKPLKEILEETERTAIVNALVENKGKKTLTAKALGISRNNLYEKMEKYNINEK